MAWDSVYLTKPQVVLRLLVQGSDFENQGLNSPRKKSFIFVEKKVE